MFLAQWVINICIVNALRNKNVDNALVPVRATNVPLDFLGVTSDSQGILRTRPGRLGTPRETLDTLVSKHIMDLFYVTVYYILHIIILLIILYNL